MIKLVTLKNNFINIFVNIFVSIVWRNTNFCLKDTSRSSNRYHIKKMGREGCSTTSQHATGWAKCLRSQNDTGKAWKYKLAALESALYCSGSTGQAGMKTAIFLHSKLAPEKGISFDTWQETGNHQALPRFCCVASGTWIFKPLITQTKKRTSSILQSFHSVCSTYIASCCSGQ